MIGLNLRPLPGNLARFCGFSRRRPYEFAADVIALWHLKDYDPEIPVFTEIGPVHLTLAAHESVRSFSLPRVGWHGICFQRDRSTWTLTMIAFCFTLTLMWCWRPNIEKVDAAQIAGSV